VAAAARPAISVAVSTGEAMDQSLIAEWQALKKAHDDAHHSYLYVHSMLADRLADAAKGIRRPTPIAALLDAHEGATERWYLAKRKLHAFCRTNASVC
jgi:hypothetical protein